METDPATLSPPDAYRLLISCVVPRPIAWVSTVDAEGRANLAPFSFFAGVTSAPPIVMIGVGRSRGARKDTAARKPAPGTTGLYHVAIHVPDAAEFAYVLARLDSARYPHSPTEHVFSKATYLDDLDGIGIEITLETPWRVQEVRNGPAGIELIDQDGIARPGVGHLDIQEAMSHLAEKEIRPLKAGTWIGHVHVHVNDIEAARVFYSDVLGYPVGLDWAFMGMLDVHFEGEFKHRIAFNGWQGPGADQRPEGTVGLRHFTLVLPGQAELDATLARLAAAEIETVRHGGGHMAADPSGNRILLVAKP